MSQLSASQHLETDNLVATFLDHIERDRGRSPNTVATYARTLRTLDHPATATRDEVEAWWDGRTHLSPATRINELSAVRSFYRWCRKWDHREDDPTYRLDAPKQPKGLPHPVSRHDLGVLLDKLTPELQRAVALGAYGGLRVSEAGALDWRDIDLESHRIRVLGKGGKERLVGCSPLLLDRLLPNTGGNVVRGGGGPYAPGTLQRKVNRAIQAAGVNATYHGLRHRFGTMAVAGGASLLSVSRAMGHASPATTAIYVATSDADLDVIADAVTR